MLKSCLEDGLTACPICGARMKEEAVYPHLDVHNESAASMLPARWIILPHCKKQTNAIQAITFSS